MYTDVSMYRCLYLCVGFPGGSNSKKSTSKAGDAHLISRSGRSPGDGNGTPLQYPCLGNPMDREAWQASVYEVTKDSEMTVQAHHFILQLYPYSIPDIKARQVLKITHSP